MSVNHWLNIIRAFECCQNVYDYQHPIFWSEKEIGPVSDVQYVQVKLKDFFTMDEIQHMVSTKWLILNGKLMMTSQNFPL